MASSAPQGSVDPLTAKDPAKALTAVASGFIENVKRNRQSFFQFFAMTGILLLSFRSVSQKYRIHDLEEDTAVLKKEHESLTDRMNKIKSDLLHQASIDSTGVFASRIRLLFGDDKK
ncbi:hypothetical protein CARUB_v10019044mg [Capsella rubella]|uniref:Uncharacterized protein n=1 Tax=Capsella rubella TaxID=81985 RepID=R0FTA6_9BRAS|nr:uncharacterized protein LOC17884898 [Capsella rubella]XP_023639251.1 uncharacterized protein LOC17884898 [Capsella rubella]EOA25691.1 hypothetical protein CARUB_v10019044mg [Capsella rubella]